MRRIVLLSLLASLSLISTADARLFWQTYGSVVQGSDGCGSSWNWNQDYFVPRHADSCRYGLFSPCKTSCTTSPASKWCHPIHQGYCSPYGPCHYGWRNHVYKTYCGSSPLCVNGPYRAHCCKLGFYGRHFCGQGCCGTGCRVPYRQGCGPACDSGSGICRDGICEPAFREYSLPNVEAPGFEVLGSISVEGDGLLANIDLTPVGDQTEQRVFLSPQGADMPQILPSLGLQDTTSLLPSEVEP